MSRRPPGDSSSSFQPVAATAAPSYRGQPAPAMRARNYSGYRSPFQQPAHPGISSLVDFREGVQIVDEHAGAPGFLEYNGRSSYTPTFVSSEPAVPIEAEDVEVTDHDLRQMIDRNLKSNTARRAAPANEMRSRAIQGHAVEHSSETDRKIDKLLKDLDRLKRENDARLQEMKTEEKPIAAKALAAQAPRDDRIEKILADLERMRKENEEHSAKRVSAPFQSRASRLSTEAYRTMVRA